MKKTFITLITLFFNYVLYAQSMNLEWTHTVGAVGVTDNVQTIETDASGNTYVAGFIRGNSVGSIPISHSGNVNQYDLYISKINSLGVVLWTSVFPANGLSEGMIRDLAIGPLGQVFFCGNLSSGSMDLNPGPGTNLVFVSGALPQNQLGLMGALDADGNYLWAGAIPSLTMISHVFINQTNEVTFAGTFFNNGGNIDMDIAPAIANMAVSSSACRRGPFIVKYSAAGNFIATTIGNDFYNLGYQPGFSSDCYTYDIEQLSSGDYAIVGVKNFYVGNTFNGVKSYLYIIPANLSPGSLNFEIGEAPGGLPKGRPYFTTLAVDEDGYLYVGGQLLGNNSQQIDFDPGPGVSNQFSSPACGFVVKYSPQFDLVRFSKIAYVVPLSNGAAVQKLNYLNGKLHVAVNFYDDIDMDPGVGEVQVVSEGFRDNCIGIYDSAMNYISHHAFGGANDDYLNDMMNLPNQRLIAFDHNGQVNNINPQDNLELVASIGGWDGSFAKYSVGIPLPATFRNFKAERYGDDAKLLWETSDEVNVSHYEIEKSNDAFNWSTLANVDANNVKEKSHYSYIDQLNHDVVNYYRIKQLDIDGAFKYSRIEKVIFAPQSQVSFFPNPCSMILNIHLTPAPQPSTIEVYSLTGTRMLSLQTMDLTHKLNVNTLTNGTYVLRVFNNQKTMASTFVKQ